MPGTRVAAEGRRLLPAIGLAHTSALVAGPAVLGLLVTVSWLPEPQGAAWRNWLTALRSRASRR